MKKLALAVAAAFLAGSVLAAPYNGFYAGGSAGYGSGDANQTRYGNIGGPLVFTQLDASLDGWTFGAFGGHNWTQGSMVFGVEGNWDFGGPVGDDGEALDRNEWDQNWEASVRGRLGFLVNPSTLLYATAGYSWADYDSNVLNAPVSSRSHTFGGWTYGVGLEFGLGGSMTGRVQYRHNEYDAENVSLAPAEGYYIQAGPSIDTFSVGLAFHL